MTPNDLLSYFSLYLLFYALSSLILPPSQKLCKDGVYHDSKKVKCPGICPALRNCRACVSQGQGSRLKDISTTSTPAFKVWGERIQVKQCTWCVKEASCQNRNGKWLNISCII